MKARPTNLEELDQGHAHENILSIAKGKRGRVTCTDWQHSEHPKPTSDDLFFAYVYVAEGRSHVRRQGRKCESKAGQEHRISEPNLRKDVLVEEH